MGKYDDIINLKRPASKHPKMSLYQRSAQFAPYSALTGYEGQVKETARLTDRRIELDEELKVILDMKIQVIQELISNKPELEVTYFIPDSKKDGGRYETILDNINKINGNIELFTSNINKIFNAKKNVTFRIPMAPNYIYTEKNIEYILKFLEEYKPNKVEIFKIHNLADKKYKTLGKKIMRFDDITQEQLEEIKEKIESLKVNVEICKI